MQLGAARGCRPELCLFPELLKALVEPPRPAPRAASPKRLTWALRLRGEACGRPPARAVPSRPAGAGRFGWLLVGLDLGSVVTSVAAGGRVPSSASLVEVVPPSPAACTSLVLIASALVHGRLSDCLVSHRHCPSTQTPSLVDIYCQYTPVPSSIPSGTMLAGC